MSGTLIRTLVLLLALINQVLVALGKSPLPIEDAEIERLVSAAFTIIAALIAWWKNNPVTEEAIQANEYMEQLKAKKR